MAGFGLPPAFFRKGHDMKTKSVIVLKSLAGKGVNYGRNKGQPQDLPEHIADDLLRAGHAITPGEAKKAAAPKKQTTTAKTSKETTAK